MKNIKVFDAYYQTFLPADEWMFIYTFTSTGFYYFKKLLLGIPWQSSG